MGGGQINILALVVRGLGLALFLWLLAWLDLSCVATYYSTFITIYLLCCINCFGDAKEPSHVEAFVSEDLTGVPVASSKTPTDPDKKSSLDS